MGRAILCFGAMPLAALAVGCASSVERVDGAFHHRRHSYTIASPDDPTLYEELKILVGGANRSMVVCSLIQMVTPEEE